MNGGRISRMNGQVSSPESHLPGQKIPAQWRLFAGFLRTPVLPDRAAGISRGAIAAILRLYLLDLLLMIGLLLVALGVYLTGFKFPDTALGTMELTPVLIALVVFGAPIMEELAFRGWLSGRPGQLVPLLVVAGTVALLPLVQRQHSVDTALATLLAMLAGLLLAILAAVLLRGRPPFGWFRRHFRWFYYLSALLFAGIHLTNYENTSPLFLLLVIPQGIAGLIFGFARVRYGLWASMVLHIIHNATFIGLALTEKLFA